MSKTPIHAKIRIVPVVLAFLAAALMCQAQFQIVVPYNQTWKFEQSNIDLGTTWKDPGFDDSGPNWGTGIGPLGFNNLSTNEALLDGLTVFTLLNRTTNAVQPRTYYFRTTFQFTNDPAGVSLVFSNLIDDAAVFWINGVEMGRAGFNAPTVVTFATPGDRAASDVGTYGYDRFTNATPGLIQGVNTYAVEVHQTGNNSSDLVMATRVMAVIPTPLTVTLQPTNITATENRVVNLVVGVAGTAPQFQWYRGTNPAVVIPDATNAIYNIANTALADTDDYFVIATNSLNSATSLVARLTISNDTNGPVLLSVQTDDTFQRIILTWDETISSGQAIEVSSYIIRDSLDNDVTINFAEYLGNVVVLHVPTLQPDSDYSVEADGQQDPVGNPTLPVGLPIGDPNGVQTNLHTWMFAPGFTRFQAYLGLPTGQNISQFTAMPIYPNSPTFSFYTNVLYWPQSVPGRDQYAMRFTGLFVATETGTHRFNPAHDDELRLRIYPSEDPNGTPLELTSASTSGLTDGPTLDVAMVAGNRYYYELIVRELAGGEYAGLGVTAPSGAVASPIGSQFLAAAADPSGVSVTITQQPANKVFVGVAGTSLLSQDFNTINGGFTVTTPQTYDGPWVYSVGTGSWQQNGQDTENSHPNTSLLDSPGLVLTVTGEVILSFDHRYSFEQDATSWDGGQVRLSVNGSPFTTVPGSAFSSNSYNGAVGAGSSSLLAGQPAFVGTSNALGGFITSAANLGTFNAGDMVRVEFMAASDSNTKGPLTPNWEIDLIQLTQGSVVNVSFSVGASATNVSGASLPKAYQWFRDNGAGFVPIPGANSAVLSFAPQPSDNGALFRVTVSTPGASATSAAATLTIAGAAPHVDMVRQGDGQIVISWTGSFCLQETITLSGVTIPWGSSPVLNGVPFTAAPGHKFYRLISCP